MELTYKKLLLWISNNFRISVEKIKEPTKSMEFEVTEWTNRNVFS